MFPLAGSYNVGVWSPSIYVIQFSMTSDAQYVVHTSFSGLQYDVLNAVLSIGLASKDLSIARLSAGVAGIGTGAGGFAGRLKLTSTIVAATTVAALNASPTIGEISTVNDALAVTAKGATVTAGGSAIAVLVWNGSNWVGI
jgi:hypothetical protein